MLEINISPGADGFRCKSLLWPFIRQFSNVMFFMRVQGQYHCVFSSRTEIIECVVNKNTPRNGIAHENCCRIIKIYPLTNCLVIVLELITEVNLLSNNKCCMTGDAM